jgi:zinc protease
MKIQLICIALIVSLVSHLKGQAQPDLKAALKLDPAVRTGTLSNGLTYFIRKNSKPAKRAELRLAVNAGSNYENDDQQGLAHFCEHMAFNGSKNFKKSELVDYLESVGTKFGPHLNAYTSFDETVYMLQLPTDKEEILQKGFQILEDWAHNLSFDSVEIDKERGVVLEEWRLGKGAEERMRNKYFPILFKDSRYAVRLPIGQPEIIKNCKYSTLKQFYYDWYRPDLMAVIAVGDFDVDKIEKLIKEKFSSIPSKKDPRKTQVFDVPDNKEMLIAKATDKEATNARVQVMYKHNAKKTITVGDYRTNLLYRMYTGMLRQRYDEIRQQPNSPFSFAGCFYGAQVRTEEAYSTYSFLSSDKNIEQALEVIAEENERAKRYGFSHSEFERYKKDYLRNLEVEYEERDKTESRNYVGEYVYYFLTGSPAPGIEFDYKITKQLVSGIGLSEVNALSNTLTTNGENCVVVITAPDKEGVVLPEDDKIKSIFANVSKADIKPYADVEVSKPLLTVKPSPGKVIAEKKIPELGITIFTLSNGAKVYLKPTDFKNDEVLLNAFSYGGSGLYPDKDMMSASFAGYIVSESGLGSYDNISLQKYLSGKLLHLYMSIGDISEHMSGETTPQDMETFLQMLYLYFTAPHKDSTAFRSLIQQQMGWVQNRASNPESALQDTVQLTLSNHHPRSKLYTPELLKEIDLERGYAIYKDRFADAGDFTFYFVGHFDIAKIKPLIETYIASLPATGRKETWKDMNYTSPKGRIEKTVYKGKEQKAKVEIHYYGDFEYNNENKFNMRALTQLMNIKLREILREEKSGTYGVQVSPYSVKYPKQKYFFTISFGCAPENADMLLKATLDELETIKKEGCNEKDLTKIKETFKRELETSLKENNFWLRSMESKVSNGEPLEDLNGQTKNIDALKGEDFKVFAKMYFSTTDLAIFKLLPEK